jgi:hypothetical protein
MTKQHESSSWVEVGGYIHQDEGSAKAKLYVGDPNKPLQIDDAALTKRLKKVRVTMNVSEDTGVYKNQVYEKDINMVQTIMDEPSSKGGLPGTTSTGKEYLGTTDPSTAPTGDLTPMQILKNMIDGVWSDNRAQWVVIAAAILVAAVALGLAIAG